jgi:hypothetical protein
LRWVRRTRPGRVVRRPALRLEPLESRDVPTALLTYNTSTVDAAQQIFTGPMARAGYDLSLLYTDYLTFNSGPAAAPYQPVNSLLQIANGYVVVDVLPTTDAGLLNNDLKQLGFLTLGMGQYVVSGRLPISNLESASMLASVRSILPAYRAMTSVGAVDSQGPTAQQSDVPTNFLGLDGTGRTIGVISDSFGSAAADVASGDLPGPGNPNNHTVPVNVIDDSLGGTDEGRAMLQIVHDTAPGANLAFATGGASQTQFRDNIIALANSAASVIVDDFQFLNEPMFMDGIVAKAVDQVAANGVAYYSAAGNNGRSSYEQAYRDSGIDLAGTNPDQVPIGLSPTFIAHDFDPGPGVDLFQTITLPAGRTDFSFQWDDSFFSVNGGPGARTNMNLAVFGMDGKFMSGTGGFTNNIGGDAVEVFSINNPTGAAMQVQFAIGRAGGPAPTLLKYVAFQPAGQTTFAINEYATNSGTIFGHANARNASAVGAALYSETPPYGVSPPTLESYSSWGGTPILFDAAGGRLAAPQVRQSPDIVAPDGVNTTFFGQSDSMGSGGFEGDGFPNFFGTSAAAPHAAAVAAILQQAKPGITVAQINQALDSTAIDMGAAGYDNASGWGLINATAAVISVNGGPYNVTFHGTSGSDAMIIRRDLSGNSIEFVRGGVVQLSIPASQVASIQVDGRAGGDSLTIDSRNGAIARSVSFDGGIGGGDSFQVLGTADLPAEINAFSDAAPIPTVTFQSGTLARFSIKDVESTVLDVANGIVNLIGDNNSFAVQADVFDVRGTGPHAFTTTFNGSPPVQFQNVDSLSVTGGLMADEFRVSPWASNATTGWGIQTTFNGGTGLEGDLLVYNTVAANAVSEAIVVQPATAGAGEIRALNAGDGSAIAIISYVNTDLAVNDSDGFASDTDTLELRGTNAAEAFNVDLTAAGTSSAPMVEVRSGSNELLYKLRSFSGFSTLGIVGYGASDLVNLVAGRNDGTVSLDVDLGLPVGGQFPSDRDRIQVQGSGAGSDVFHYTASAEAGTGLASIRRAGASAPTLITFRSVESLGFDGGGLSGADAVVLDGTIGNDFVSVSASGPYSAIGQVNSGPALDFTNLGAAGSTIAMNGLDGADSFSFTQVAQWGVAGVFIDGGAGADSTTITGTMVDDRYTWTASAGLLTAESPDTWPALPFLFSGIESILVDALGQFIGDRLVIIDPISYTPTANSGTVPTNPPLSYRNVEFFTSDQQPSLGNDFATTLEDTSVLIGVLDNDTGIDDAPLTITIASPPLHGTAVVVGNKILYTPAKDYNDAAGGADLFSYRVTDSNGDSATATVSVSIAPVNDAPIATSGTVLAQEDTDTPFLLVADDGDPETPQSLTYSIVSGPTRGTILSFNPATGAVVYRPGANFSGSDFIAFQVQDDSSAGGPPLFSNIAVVEISVTGANDTPIANGQSIAVNEDIPTGFTLTGDDGDPEVIQTLTFTIVQQPLHGTLLFNPTTGKGTYTPAFNYHGPDFFTFTVTDDATAGGPAKTSAPAMVAIGVDAVNDPPIAISTTVSGTEDGTIPVVLTADDGDPDENQVLTYALIAMPQHGTLSGFNPNTGYVLYTPDPNFAGTDLFTFIVTDDSTAGGPPRTSPFVGTIVLNVQGVNDRPTANAQSVSVHEDTGASVTLTGDDGDAEVEQALFYVIVSGPLHGTISKFDSATGTFLYTPDANFNGTDEITFTVSDDASAGGPALTSAPAKVTFTISAVNDAPTADSKSVSVVGNRPTTITLTGDDGDPELTQNLTFTITSGPAHGTLVPLSGTTTASGSLPFVYRPNPGYVGSDSFTFTTTDSGSLTSTIATVTIDVTRPPDGLTVVGAGEGGGPHVKAFNARTGELVASFFAYDPSFTGGVRVAAGDIDGDGIPDIITGAGVGGFPHIKVFSGKDLSLIASFFAFDQAFAGGVTVASGDIDGLPGDEIVVGAGAGGGPNVRTFKLVNGRIEQLAGPLGSFFAYDPSFTGGVNVAVGNFDGLPGDEIITGAGFFGGPHVKVFSNTKGVIASFFAFPDDGRLGVTVAVGDVDGDGKAEIITGSGVGGGPVVRLFDGGTAALRAGFAAFDIDYRGGIAVGTVDADSDGKADIQVAPSQVSRSIQIFDGESLHIIDQFSAFDSDFLGGVYVAGK